MLTDEDAIDFKNTWLHFYPSDLLGKTGIFPAMMTKAEGIYITDHTGKQYIDAISGAYCVNVGYGRNSIIDAASHAAKEIAFSSPFSFANPYAYHLAQKLTDLALPVVGPNARVFFTNSGSEAVETALKIARAYAYKHSDMQRKWLLSKEQSYHGVTLGALSVNGFAHLRKEFGPLLPMTARIPAIRDSVDTFQELLTATPGRGQDVAGVLVETIETSNGMQTPTLQYLDGLKRFREATGALLMIDEVITGFGRIGQWFSAQTYGLEADMIVCAKGLTSGYESLGATIVSERVADVFAHGDGSMFYHGATFGGRPAAAAAALENIAILEQENLLNNAFEMGAYFQQLLKNALLNHPRVSEITGAGLLLAIHIKEKDASLPASAEVMGVIRDRLLHAGVITSLYSSRTDPVIELAPPLCINKKQLNCILNAIIEALN